MFRPRVKGLGFIDSRVRVLSVRLLGCSLCHVCGFFLEGAGSKRHGYVLFESRVIGGQGFQGLGFAIQSNPHRLD